MGCIFARFNRPPKDDWTTLICERITVHKKCLSLIILHEILNLEEHNGLLHFYLSWFGKFTFLNENAAKNDCTREFPATLIQFLKT